MKSFSTNSTLKTLWTRVELELATARVNPYTLYVSATDRAKRPSTMMSTSVTARRALKPIIVTEAEQVKEAVRLSLADQHLDAFRQDSVSSSKVEAVIAQLDNDGVLFDQFEIGDEAFLTRRVLYQNTIWVHPATISWTIRFR